MIEFKQPDDLPTGSVDAEDLVRRILAECNFAAANDMRLPRNWSQREGEIAVPEYLILAAIEGWRFSLEKKANP
ncbi:hypothetical protein [Variovorax sp. UMC13]|uniref:hypothetical protein n=1 Tax=Variovorax sp. UMC13 TaxID=1862326 RepID=UPI00160247EF|nr:hypothetical protein [Variovorax sp. UMC13]